MGHRVLGAVDAQGVGEIEDGHAVPGLFPLPGALLGGVLLENHKVANRRGPQDGRLELHVFQGKYGRPGVFLGQGGLHPTEGVVPGFQKGLHVAQGLGRAHQGSYVYNRIVLQHAAAGSGSGVVGYQLHYSSSAKGHLLLR